MRLGSPTTAIPRSTSPSTAGTGSFDRLGTHIPMGRPSVDSPATLDYSMQHASGMAAMSAHSSRTSTFSIQV